MAISVGGIGDACLVFDGDFITMIAVGEVTAGGGLNLGAAQGPLLSNAEHHRDILGPSFCVGVTVGWKIEGAVELCFGLNESLSDFTGIYTLWGGAGPGFGSEIHGGLAYAVELFSLDTPCLSGWDLPRVGPFDLPKLPSLGCG